MNFYQTEKSGPLAKNIVQKVGQTVTYLNLKAGSETGWHDVPYSVIVVPFEGELIFQAEDESQVIHPGHFVEMEPGERHNVIAKRDSGVIVVKSKLAKKVN